MNERERDVDGNETAGEVPNEVIDLHDEELHDDELNDDLNDDDLFVDPSAPAAPTGTSRARDAGRARRRPEPSGPNEEFPTLGRRASAWWDRLVARVADDPGRAAEAGVSLVVVALGTALVLTTLNPGELWRDTTPTGGDMGAHVWGPRYLLDNVLPDLRLTGWTPDWYNGFPAYQFYMVVPPLMIVGLHVGLVWYAAVPVVLGAAVAAVAGWARPRLYPYRYLLVTLAALVVVLAVPLPYNRSFKLVTAIGLLAMPVACWAFAKLADLPFPIPPLASVAGLIFLYNREPIYNNTGNIIGGNFHSTMAGEFAFSVSLTLSILYLGVAARGLRTGRHRALAAVLFALAGLCHLIPAFFVLACTAAMLLIHPDRARLRWLSTMVPVAGLLTAFWVLPFWWRRNYVNDMGWERLPIPNAELTPEAAAIAGDQSSITYYLFPPDLRWLMVAAALGVVVSIVRRYTVGVVLATAWVGVMVAFSILPQYRLWNARLLPFMFLSVALLAAIAVGEIIKVAGAAASGRPDRPLRSLTTTTTSLAALGVLVYVSLPLTGVLDSIYDREAVSVDVGTAEAPQTETVTRSSFLLFETDAVNSVSGWADWNYQGLEQKEASPPGCDQPGSEVACTSGGWPEYRDLMATMAALGDDPAHGCGRAMWEYDNARINGYGTPMAPMLLPYWTDGCIGSQEGLYFESSTTVPFHFLVQSELSTEPSRPQRELPYPEFDIDAGINHLQLLGVRYYLAVTPNAVISAQGHADLTEVAVSGPWHVFTIDDAPLVEPLAFEPVVVTGIDESQDGWLPTMVAWFLDPDSLDALLAADGPAEWQRVEAEPVDEEWRRLVRWTRDQLGQGGPMDPVPTPAQPRTELPEITVSDVEQDTDGLSFRVSEPGVPVLVKVSYFPNWEVSGAEGPYRVSPNLMVVVPTEEQVTMSYPRTPVDLAAGGLSVVGLVALVLLARRRPVEVAPYGPGRASAWLDDLVRPRRGRGARDRAPGAPAPGDPADAWATDDGLAGNGLAEDGLSDDWATGDVPAGAGVPDDGRSREGLAGAGPWGDGLAGGGPAGDGPARDRPAGDGPAGDERVGEAGDEAADQQGSAWTPAPSPLAPRPRATAPSDPEWSAGPRPSPRRKPSPGPRPKPSPGRPSGSGSEGHHEGR